jgi:hypothetical protein
LKRVRLLVSTNWSCVTRCDWKWVSVCTEWHQWHYIAARSWIGMDYKVHQRIYQFRKPKKTKEAGVTKN